jgi:hypothetical protein
MPPKPEVKSAGGLKDVPKNNNMPTNANKKSTPGFSKSLSEDMSALTMDGSTRTSPSVINGNMPIINRTKKGTMSARAAIEDAQILGTDNIDDYETSKAALRGRKAVIEDDRRAVLDLERWDGPQPNDIGEDF